MHHFKQFVKYVVGYFRCFIAGVSYSKHVYVGRHVHFANGANIRIGNKVQLRPDVDLFAGDALIIGDGCDIGTRNRIAGNVVIGDNVLIGPDNFICSYSHNYMDIDTPIIHQGSREIRKNGHNELKISDGCWIGTHVAILGDVHIGKNCVIGANSVVSTDVPDYCVVAGAPAKIVKRYNQETLVWEKV